MTLFPHLSRPALRGLLSLLAILAAASALAQETPLPLAQPPPKTDSDAGATVVVYNENDPDSHLLADFYASKRGVPPEQVIGLKCSVQEEITRQEYDDTIADPLRRTFTSNFWWKLREADSPSGPVESCRIRYVALMRGIPLKIAPATAYTGDKPFTTNLIGVHNEAAVDSELALLGHRLRTISGAVTNPYFRSYTAFHEAHRPDLLLVCRLDGPSPTVVRRMIVDSLNVEAAGGLRGFAYIDARGIAPADTGLYEGDQWLMNAAQDLRRLGMPVILDNGPAIFPEGYPMRYAALYLGWYNDPASGPFVRPGFRFLPGAIAVHIHSYSAATVRDPKARWVGPLLETGAAATLGNVYEPYLSLTPHLDIFEERLRLGFNFAESAYAAQRVLSWMTTFVGDPLYRPFPPFPAVAAKGANAEWDAYKKGAAQWEHEPKAGAAMLQADALKLKSGIIAEGLALLQAAAGNHPGAVDTLEEARRFYTNPEDILRVTIHEVIQLRGMRQDTAATTLAKKEAAAFPTAPAISVLQMLVPAAFPARQP